MKEYFNSRYYELAAEFIVHHELYFWDPSLNGFVDEDGFEIENIFEVVPMWAMQIAELHAGPGTDNYFAFNPNSWTLIELFWPDEEEIENWYR